MTNNNIDNTIQELINEKTKWGEEHGFKVDPVAMERICRALPTTNGVCPCKTFRATTPELVKALTCPCTEMEDEIKEKGRCCCGIYLKKD